MSDNQTEEIPDEFPPVVYVPCESHVAQLEDAVVQLREVDDGRLALPVYSALDRLYSCCGRHQPWLLMQSSGLDRLQEVAPFELILIDLVIPEEQRIQE